MFTDCRCVDIIMAGREREGENVCVCVCVCVCEGVCLSVMWVSGCMGGGDMNMERTRLHWSDTYLNLQAYISISYCNSKISGKIIWSFKLMFCNMK